MAYILEENCRTDKRDGPPLARPNHSKGIHFAMATSENTTRRASAPKPEPSSVESVRRKTAELKSSTAALMAAKAVERELEDPNVAEAVALWRHFVRTHSRAEIGAAQAELERKFPRKSAPAAVERLVAELDDPNSLMKNE